jgi:dynein heavy chain
MLASTFPGGTLSGSLRTTRSNGPISPTRRSPTKGKGTGGKPTVRPGSTSSAIEVKDRESFRDALVQLINQQEDTFAETVGALGSTGGGGGAVELAPPPAQTGAVGEKDVLRYYYYINNGIDTEHIEAMDDAWVTNIMAFVDLRLQHGRQTTIESLWDEVRDDYLTSIKKAIVDFVLKDESKGNPDAPDLHSDGGSGTGAAPGKSEGGPPSGVTGLKRNRYSMDLNVVPKPWASTFAAARASMADTLHLNHPSVQLVLHLWSDFDPLRLLRVDDVAAAAEPYELAAFVEMAATHAADASRVLKKEWIASVVNELQQRKRHLPKKHMASFFECVATIMDGQLRTCLLHSLADYKRLFQDEVGGDNPRGANFKGFVTRLVAKDNEIVFEPSFAAVEQALLRVVEQMKGVVAVLPRAETLLPFAPDAAEEYLRPTVWDADVVADGGGGEGPRPVPIVNEVEPVRAQLLAVLAEQQQGAVAVATGYRTAYAALIDRTADSDVAEFLDEPHSFEEYIVKITELKALVTEISYERPREIRKGMYYVTCRLVNKELVRRANGLAEKLVKRMKEDANAELKELSARFEVIADKALETPTDTDHLMALKAYVAKAKAKEVPALQKQVEHNRKRLDFMLSNATMSSTEMSSNADLFTWLGRLGPIFDKHETIVKSARDKAENTLKQKRVAFNEEMAAVQQALVEYNEWGDVAATAEYLAKADAVNAQLEVAQETIENINHQEEAFDWEITTYPAKSANKKTLEPFLSLYKACDDFRINKEKWMHGAFTEVNPEVVEDMSGNIWRLLYKSEKSLESEAAKGIASAVKAEVDEFKANLPLITSLVSVLPCHPSPAVGVLPFRPSLGVGIGSGSDSDPAQPLVGFMWNRAAPAPPAPASASQP